MATLAAEIMTRNVVSVKTDATLDRVTKIMLDRRISGLPVVNDSGRLVGIVTEGDLLRRKELGTNAGDRPRCSFGLARENFLMNMHMRAGGGWTR